jgi:molecular chaperone GrpE
MKMIPREPEEMSSEKPEVKDETTSDSEQDLEKALSEAKQKVEEYLDSWKRAQADFINYKRRTEQERLEVGMYANTQLILALLPILDDFERAFVSITPRLAKTDWVDGISLIERKLRTTLEAQGLSPIKSVGETFDPNLHEAVMHINGEDGKVVQEMQKGYKLHDKVIRPSKVAVGNGEPIEEQEDEDKQD